MSGYDGLRVLSQNRIIYLRMGIDTKLGYVSNGIVADKRRLPVKVLNF